nr:hypothetical protein [Hallella seregens]
MKRINMKTKKEQDKHRQPYVCPNCEVVAVENENAILVGSPPISTTPIVVPPGVDDNDTNLDDENNGVPAKQFEPWKWDEE